MFIVCQTSLTCLTSLCICTCINITMASTGVAAWTVWVSLAICGTAGPRRTRTRPHVPRMWMTLATGSSPTMVLETLRVPEVGASLPPVTQVGGGAPAEGGVAAEAVKVKILIVMKIATRAMRATKAMRAMRVMRIDK